MQINIQYLTPEGYKELQHERDVLKRLKIPEIANRIDEAKQQGDLSENAEYHQAKDDMAWAQGRLMELNQILENAELISKPVEGSNNAGIGNTVIFRTANGTIKEYMIVGPQEADPIQRRISNESPIGRAFLGCNVGETVKVETPSGLVEYQIVEIK
ncbi:MAG: transcription elongation factor GreA [bacterium]